MALDDEIRRHEMNYYDERDGYPPVYILVAMVVLVYVVYALGVYMRWWSY